MGIRQFKACLDTLNVGFEYKPKTSKNDIPLIFSGCIEISIGEVAVFAESKAFIYTKFVCQWILSEPLRCPDGRIIKKYWESDSLEKKPDSWRSCSPFLLYRKIVSMCKRETIRVLDRRQWKKGKKWTKAIYKERKLSGRPNWFYWLLIRRKGISAFLIRATNETVNHDGWLVKEI